MKKAKDGKEKAKNAHSGPPQLAVEGLGGGGGGGGAGGEEEDGDLEMVTMEIQLDVVTQTAASKDREDDFDWWSKFYASLKNSPLSQVEYKQLGYDRLEVCV